jgi:hypothetical protein
MLDGRPFMTTGDAWVVALGAGTGRTLWESKQAAKQSPVAKCVLPVPESPMKMTGSARLIYQPSASSRICGAETRGAALKYGAASSPYLSGSEARLRRGPDMDGSGARRGADPVGDFRRDGSVRFRRLDGRGAGRLHGDREDDYDQDQGRQMKQVPCAVHREGREPTQMRASFKGRCR